MIFKLSPSALNLMKECPRYFWLAQHKVLKNALMLLNGNYINKYCKWCEEFKLEPR